MNDFLFRPGKVQRIGDAADDFCRFPGGNFLFFFQDTFHGVAIDQLHGKIVNAIFFSNAVRLHDIGVADSGRSPGFPDKIFYKLSV